MLSAEYLAKKFAAALPYEQHVASAKPEHQQRWREVYDRLALTSEQSDVMRGFSRDMKVLVTSGTWCGDCVAQCPMMQRVAEANPDRIDLRFVDRDAHVDLAQRVKINQGLRVPTAIFMAEDHEFVALVGDRTLSRYRAIASQRLGVSCVIPGAPAEADEEAATLADWANEFERASLLLRLSPRLRKIHGD